MICVKDIEHCKIVARLCRFPFFSNGIFFCNIRATSKAVYVLYEQQRRISGRGFDVISSPEPKAHLVSLGLCRPSSSSVVVRRRPSSSSTLFKHLLLRNHWANQSQISYGASMRWRNESLLKCSWSHDEDGRHAHIW